MRYYIILDVLLILISNRAFSQDSYRLTDTFTKKTVTIDNNAIGIIFCDGIFAAGTGFVLNKPNYVVTCSHVINHSKKYEYLKYNGKHVPLTLIVKDTINDIALLRSDSDICLNPLIFEDLKGKKKNDRIVYVGFKPSKDSVWIINVGATSISTIGEKNMQVYCEFIGTIVFGHSGGPVINEETGLVFAIMRESTMGEIHHVRGYALSPILPYIK